MGLLPLVIMDSPSLFSFDQPFFFQQGAFSNYSAFVLA